MSDKVFARINGAGGYVVSFGIILIIAGMIIG